MDISTAASMFDNQPVLDAYTEDLVFVGQPLNYDGSVRDSVASWRQAISALKVIVPARGVVKFGNEVFIAGRIIQDFFQGDVVRENLILHPCDGTYQQGAATNFLTAPVDIIPFHGGVTWRKSTSDEKESPELHNVCDIYLSKTETYPTPDDLILADNSIMYRVISVENREGGFIVAVCNELGFNVVVDASYIKKGVYDSATDAMADGVPIALKAIVELTRTNFKFLVADTAKYEPGDRVITVRNVDVVSPDPEDSVTVSGVVYRVISACLDDRGSCWELHCRRA